MMPTDALKALLEAKVQHYNQPSFITNDPISVPHRFSKKQDVEIAALFAAVLAWGNRTTIINNTNRLMQWMDNAPHDFILHHEANDLKRFLAFAHRTFNATDALYFIHWLKHHYATNDSLETAFSRHLQPNDESVENALIGFRNDFFSLPDAPERTKKHIATPLKNSACKRLNMLLRWMVRKDDKGVDFGIWQRISPSQLVCPLDVHVHRVAMRLGLVTRPVADWKAALELTNSLRKMDANDPAKYDFALFSLGVIERF